MRELVMFWRRASISVLPYLNDFMFMKQGFGACDWLSRRVDGDLVRAGLRINVPKCRMILAQQRWQLGFEVDFAAGEFQVLADRWEALKASMESILAARQGRVQALTLASVTGTVLSMHLSWSPVTLLYTRHHYDLINSSVESLDCWVILTEEVVNELTFWQELPRLSLRAAYGPQRRGLPSKWRRTPSTSNGEGTSCKTYRSTRMSTSRRQRALIHQRAGS
jgi:hypothetical protein